VVTVALFSVAHYTPRIAAGGIANAGEKITIGHIQGDCPSRAARVSCFIAHPQHVTAFLLIVTKGENAL